MMVFWGRTVPLRPGFFYAEATVADIFQPAAVALVGVTATTVFSVVKREEPARPCAASSRWP
jgi:hypothetical protein